MNDLAKGLAVFINLCTYGVGIAVAAIKLFKLNYVAVFIVPNFNYNESLFFNMSLFCMASALLGVVLVMLLGDYNRSGVTVEFPIIWAIIPAAIGVLFLYFGITGAAAREIAIMIVSALIYMCSAAVNIYTGTKVFTMFKKQSQ